MKLNGSLLFLSVIIFIPLALLLSVYDYCLLWDEASYLSNAKYFIGERNYFEVERPVLLPLIVGSVWRIFGEQVILARIVSILLSSLCIVAFYKLSSVYFKRPIFPTILFMTSPLFIYWSFRSYADIPSIAFMLLSFFLIKKDFLFLAGVSSGISFLFKEVGLIFQLSFFITCIFERKLNKFLVFLLGVVLSTLPWMTINYLTYSNPVYTTYTKVMRTQKWTEVYRESPIKQFLNLINATGLFFIPMMLGLIRFIKKGETLLISYVATFFVIFFFLVNLKLSRYLLLVLPFLYVFIYEGILNLRIRRSVKLLFIFLSILLILYSLPKTIKKESECCRYLMESIAYVKDRVKEGDVIVSNFWPYFSFYTNATVYSPWKNVTEIVEEFRPKYLVFRTQERMDISEFKLPYEVELKVTSPCGEVVVFKPKYF